MHVRPARRQADRVTTSDVFPPAAAPVVLADGTTATIRQLTLGDRPEVEVLFASASPADLYTRFFAVGHGVVERHIEHLFASHTGTVTWVVERDGHFLGIADVEPESDSVAEIAFLVANRTHGLGVGTLLLETAADDACGRGVSTFVAEVLAVNHPMIEVFREAGFDSELAVCDGDVSVRMSTTRTPVVAAATASRHALAVAQRRHTGHGDPRAAASRAQ